MDGFPLARIGAIAFVAVAITVTVLEFRETPRPVGTGLALMPAVSPPARDPLQAELKRCQALGTAAAGDSACLKTWAENRRRFLSPAPLGGQ